MTITGVNLTSQVTEPTAEVLDESLIPLDSPPAAADAEAQTLNVEATPYLTLWDYLRTLLVLALVIGAIYLIFYFLKKGGKNNLPENELIRIVSSRKLQANSNLHLIEVGNSYYLIGSGENSVNLVSRISDKETADTIRLQAATIQQESKKSFKELFGNLLNPSQLKTTPRAGDSKGDGENDDSLGVESISFIKTQKDRLKNM